MGNNKNNYNYRNNGGGNGNQNKATEAKRPDDNVLEITKAYWDYCKFSAMEIALTTEDLKKFTYDLIVSFGIGDDLYDTEIIPYSKGGKITELGIMAIFDVKDSIPNTGDVWKNDGPSTSNRNNNRGSLLCFDLKPTGYNDSGAFGSSSKFNTFMSAYGQVNNRGEAILTRSSSNENAAIAPLDILACCGALLGIDENDPYNFQMIIGDRIAGSNNRPEFSIKLIKYYDKSRNRRNKNKNKSKSNFDMDSIVREQSRSGR